MADVHSSPRHDVTQIRNSLPDGFVLGGGRYEIHRATMLSLIANAYSIDADKIFGGPPWIDYNRYEIIAKTKPGIKPAVLKQMLRTLLADRFHLLLKEETQPVQGYVLTAGKGEPKMNRSESDEPEGCQMCRPNPR
jgi:uncharacterized protein (TIGR03435 family)